MLSDSESESESESSTDEEANAKSKAIHARDHWKREQEKKAKRQQLNWKSDKLKKKLLHRICLPQGILFKQQLQQQQPVLLQLVNLLQQMPAQSGGHLIDYMFTMRGRVWKGGHKEQKPWQKYETISALVAY
jgi:hypothetical protein